MPRKDLFRLSGVSTRIFDGATPPIGRQRPSVPYLSMSTVYALWDAVALQLNGHTVLRTAATAVPLSKLGVFGFLCMTAPTLEEALRGIRASFSLLTDSGHWGVRVDARSYTLVWNRTARSIGQCVSTETMLAQVYDNLSGVCGAPLPLQNIYLAHSRLASSAALEGLIDAPVHCDAPENSLSISREFLSHKPSHANADLFQHFLEASRREIERREARRGIVLATQQVIEACLGEQSLTERRVAERLELTPRTLQRQLSSRGTSFRAERERVLKARAHGLVTMTRRPLADIAETLGFSDPSAFSHAFRRWFGVSPNALRSQSR